MTLKSKIKKINQINKKIQWIYFWNYWTIWNLKFKHSKIFKKIRISLHIILVKKEGGGREFQRTVASSTNKLRSFVIPPAFAFLMKYFSPNIPLKVRCHPVHCSIPICDLDCTCSEASTYQGTIFYLLYIAFILTFPFVKHLILPRGREVPRLFF